MTDHDESLQQLRDIIEDERVCMLTSSQPDGSLHSHPMSTQDVEYDGHSWFILSAKSETARNVQERPEVNLAFATKDAWASIAGTAELLQDEAKKDELWNVFVEAWFPDGKDDPDVRILHVTGSTANWWDSPGKVAMTLSMVTSAVTKNPPSSGESDTVRLSTN